MNSVGNNQLGVFSSFHTNQDGYDRPLLSFVMFMFSVSDSCTGLMLEFLVFLG